MARLEGGIFSRPRGKTAGIVFGAARTRQGKVATARQLVPPSNPNTVAQQTQRTKFKTAQDVVRSWGSGVYRNGFNRAISQLPGYQSLQSIMTNALGNDLVFEAPPETRLGTLPMVQDLVIVNGVAGTINVTWNAAEFPGLDITSQVSVIVVVQNYGSATGGAFEEKEGESKEEVGTGQATINGMIAGESYLVGVYIEGAGTNAGNRANCLWQIALPE